MQGKVRVGVIGIGFMGSTHFRIYRDNPRSEVVAIADVDPAKIKGDWSKIVGNIGNDDNSIPVDVSKLRTYSDGMDLINDPNVDLVDICVPTYLHRQYAVAALNAGKHVQCEKPIGRSVDDAREMVSCAKNAKGNFSIGMCVRYWPEYQHAYEVYKSGKLGKVISATFKRVSPDISGFAWQNWFMTAEKSGGALLDLHLHDSDLVRYFFGRPTSVSSWGQAGVRTDKGVDHVFTRYSFGDGTLITAEGGWTPTKGTPFEMSFQILCEKGTIRLSESGYKIIYDSGTVETPSPAKADMPTGWHVELDYILSCILEGRRPDRYIPLEEMVDSLAIIEAEERSVREGREVRVEY